MKRSIFLFGGEEGSVLGEAERKKLPGLKEINRVAVSPSLSFFSCSQEILYLSNQQQLGKERW